MKYLLAILSLSFFSFTFNGNRIPKNKLPQQVTVSFNNKFSSAEKTEWYTAAHGAYEAEFEILNMDYKAEFSKTGNLNRYKHDIKLRSIPGIIASKLAENYSGYKIEKTEKLVVGSTTYYQIALDASPSQLKKVFTPSGKEARKMLYWD